MRKMDADGFALCKLQADAFEASADYMPGSSAIFVRRFMYSRVAESLDRGLSPFDDCSAGDLLQGVFDEYAKPPTGSVKMGREQLHWMGYLYRYWAYRYEMPSSKIYKLVNGKELNVLFYSYHTLDIESAIERIAESKNIDLSEDQISRGVRILRKIRAA